MIAHLPDVKRVAALISPAIAPLWANGAPDLSGGSGGNNVQAVGSDRRHVGRPLTGSRSSRDAWRAPTEPTKRL